MLAAGRGLKKEDRTLALAVTEQEVLHGRGKGAVASDKVERRRGWWRPLSLTCCTEGLPENC